MDRPTAIFEIVALLLISFVLGYICARIPLTSGNSDSKTSIPRKKTKKAHEMISDIDPRDIISEPTTIKAVLTRDRKGNAIAPPIKNNDSNSDIQNAN
ncbi:hypothetical protein [Aquimarina agarilytica]|uniref:hypothetical protein n=1 Tax=Aquimarina agarilytica TaxID=1087449 RepID=UPI001E33DCA7|nr:hypothetical protein [Aquimarina agarilytica]